MLLNNPNRPHAQRALVKLLAEYYNTDKIEVFQSLMRRRNADFSVDGLFGNQSYSAMYSDLLKPVELTIFNDFIRQETDKNQIVLHHSAGWDNARRMFEIWQIDGQRAVATAIGITDSGEVVRGYDERFWAHHIGMSNNFNLARNRGSVAVEICNFGCLVKRGGLYYTWVDNFGRSGPGVTVPESKVIKLDYKGWEYYEIYTDAEIEALKKWILLQSLRWNIDLTYRHEDMFPGLNQTSQRAIQGGNGIYTHNSYLSWKTDVSPQPKLIQMLQSLD